MLAKLASKNEIFEFQNYEKNFKFRNYRQIWKF